MYQYLSCVYLVIDNVVGVPSDISVSNYKAIGELVMLILHFKDLGDTESVVTNAVGLLI